MNSYPLGSRIRFAPAPPLDRAHGLLGHVSLDLSLFALDRVALRRSASGTMRLDYPECGASDAVAPSVRVLDDAAWHVISNQVVADLERQGLLP